MNIKKGSDRDTSTLMDKINNFIVIYQTREASASPYMHFSICHIELVFASFTGMT